MIRAAPLLLLCLLASACETEGIVRDLDPELNRMIQTPKYLPYAENTFFEDRRAMRIPPEGTIRFDAELGDPLLTEGMEGERYAEAVPLPVDRALLVRGRRQFEIYCAACHGVLGNGESVVGRNMKLVKPPSLHHPRIRGFPPGRIYRIVRDGYGMMPAYGPSLGLRDRWAVAAYVKALQLSRRVPLSELPPKLRREAEEALE